MQRRCRARGAEIAARPCSVRRSVRGPVGLRACVLLHVTQATCTVRRCIFCQFPLSWRFDLVGHLGRPQLQLRPATTANTQYVTSTGRHNNAKARIKTQGTPSPPLSDGFHGFQPLYGDTPVHSGAYWRDYDRWGPAMRNVHVLGGPSCTGSSTS